MVTDSLRLLLTVRLCVCVSAHLRSGYRYAGLEYGSECHCGNRIGSPLAAEEECSLVCRGERATPCGGVGRLSVYKVEEQLAGHRKCECSHLVNRPGRALLIHSRDRAYARRRPDVISPFRGGYK